MSRDLDSLLTREQREACAKNDAQMAHGITHTTLAKVSGQHLSEAPNEPFSVIAERNALECAQLREAQHTDDWHRRNDQRARDLQMQHMDAMRRCGAI